MPCGLLLRGCYTTSRVTCCRVVRVVRKVYVEGCVGAWGRLANPALMWQSEVINMDVGTLRSVVCRACPSFCGRKTGRGSDAATCKRCGTAACVALRRSGAGLECSTVREDAVHIFVWLNLALISTE